MTKLIIFFYFNYSLSGLPMKLGQDHYPPFGPKVEPTIPNCLDRGPKHTSTTVQYTSPLGSSRACPGEESY